MSYTRLRLLILMARLKKKKIAFLLATPSHSNLGDQAIAYAEKQFLKKYLPDYIVIETRLITTRMLVMELSVISKIIDSNDIIFSHGGGNMGDQYPKEEIARRSIIQAFPNNQIIIFPQTIYFRDTDEAKKMLADTKAIYGAHKQLTLIARESTSYAFMNSNFPENTILLTPDIVLSLTGQISSSIIRKGAMTCLRKDPERSIDSGANEIIVKLLKSRYGFVHISDTVSSDKVILSDHLRLKRLNGKWGEFRRSEIVVTDRLHGMVFAAITGTPCVVFSNYNHKVSGTYEWVKSLPSVYFCDDVGNLEEAIVCAVKEHNVAYPGLDSYWSLIEKTISTPKRKVAKGNARRKRTE